jgi:DNA-directed RNA polymerase subunit RPC12/RpoP
MTVKRIRSLKVVCPYCNVPMQEQADEVAVIQFSTRTKMVVYECPKCGAETERQIAIPTDRAGNWPAGW